MVEWRRRRRFYAAVVSGTALLGLLSWAAVSLWRASQGPRTRGAPTAQEGAEAGRPSRPNILLVVYDARRRDDFSFGPFGNRRGDTPFLAGLADEALYFENAIAPGCWTVPVHASMFTGRSVCSLGNDYYNPGYTMLSPAFPSLAEILAGAGYHTVAYADHPFFYSGDPKMSLVRGFAQWSVIAEFGSYSSQTNVGTPRGAVERRSTLEGMPDMRVSELEAEMSRFNRGELRLDLEADGDYDQEHDLVIARLQGLYDASPYFDKRYRSDFDEHVFAAKDESPFFLFLNLHMCTIANPDVGLFDRWWLKTLMLNAQRRSARLEPPRSGESVRRTLNRNFRRLGLRHAFDTPFAFLKHVYDNRFYDATFRAIWRYLDGRGLMRDTAVIVTSDHGQSFGEHGEAFYLHGGARPYEYLTRVPLVLRFPDGHRWSALHRRRGEEVLLTDLFDTILDIGAGSLSPARSADGLERSLLRRLQDGRFESSFVSESALRPNGDASRPGLAGYAKAVYAEGFKLIYCPEPRRMGEDRPLDERIEPLPAAGSVSSPREAPLALLFDLARDPHESTELSAQRPEIVERLRRLVGSWDCRPEGAAPAGKPDWDPNTIETLRALGYIQ
jgi:arylsulfatase A-like enzyme